MDPDVVGVAQAIEDQFAAWGYVPQVVREVFESPSAGSIAAALDGFCREHLGAGVAELRFFFGSVGSVHGLRLRDGQEVVVKALRPGTRLARLEAVQEVQRRLHANGFPCPNPLVAPAPLARGTGVAETLLDLGTAPDGHLPVVRAAMAAGLARLVEACRPMSMLDALRSAPDGDLWSRPHDGRFDFLATSHGAEWIDEIAAAARAVPLTGDLVVGHGDWRAENLRFLGSRMSAVYDWDSLVTVREPKLVGSACGHFTSDYRRSDIRQLPTLEEALAFVSEYENVRGTPFTPAEQQTVRAALVEGAAYGARCAHSDRLTDFGRHPPLPRALWPPRNDGAADFLEAHAAQLLS
jgi:Phosphotransferase enzyme family